MATQTTVIYPFDPTGQAVSNRITGERQILTPPDWSDFYFIVPSAAPYFASSLQLTMRPSGKVLVEGIDYNPSHKFYDASIQCASPVYGSITFLDKTLAGVIEYNYQTLGGDWVINTQQAAQVLANTLLNPRTTTWEEVVNLPYQFPPVDHAWDIVDMIGASDVVNKLDEMVEALMASGDQGLALHLADFNNPHRVTKAQVGLSEVQNFAMATVPEAISGASTVKYMSPSTTQQSIIQFAVTPLNAHIGTTTNPHNVTKAQVGLGSVLNYGLAATADAQAGVATTGYMTPMLVAAAVSAQALVPLASHLADHNNPHAVTKTQLGLSNVPNLPMATLVEAQAGVAEDRFMSPFLVKAMLQTGLGGNLQAHLDDHSNPHVVTATQVGLGNVQNYGVSTVEQAVAGVDGTSYMTPAVTMVVISDQLQPFTSHLSNTTNPHSVTATQVGLGSVQNYGLATDELAIAGTDNESYMTPSLTQQAIFGQVGNAFNIHVADTANPHQVTAAQLNLDQVANYPIADVAAATVGVETSSYMTPMLTAAAIQVQVGNDVVNHHNNISNPHAVTAAQVGAYSIEDADAAILQAGLEKLDKTAQAADSLKLEGKSLSEVLDQAASIAGAVTYYTYEDDAPDVGETHTQLWTGFAQWSPPDPETLVEPRREFVGWIMGGEDVGESVVPVYRVTVNLRGVAPVMTVVQHSGTPTAERFLLSMDAVSGVVTLWLASAAARNGFALSINSNPGGDYTTLQRDVDGPTDIVADAVSWKYANAFEAAVVPDSGDLLFHQNFAVTPVKSDVVGRSSSAAVAAAPLQFLNVATNPDEIAAAALVGMPLKTEWRHFGRMASKGKEPAFAGDRTVWGWNNGTSAIQCTAATNDDALHTLLSPEAWPSGQPFMLEVECSTYPVAKSFGLCLGQYVLSGQSIGLWATVDLYAQELSLTVNLNQTSSQVIATQALAAAAIGDILMGRLRATFDGGSQLTLETTDFVYSGIGSYTAPLVVDLLTVPAAKAWLDGMSLAGGGHWGFAAMSGPVSFMPMQWPDAFARYATYAPAEDGTDLSTVMCYTGNAAAGTAGWVSMGVVGASGLIPGRLIYSESTAQFYFTRRDGTLTPLPVVGISGTGGAILTT